MLMNDSEIFSNFATEKSRQQSDKSLSSDLDPIGIAIDLSRLDPIMNQEQADQAKEIGRTLGLLAIKKLEAASKGDKSNFDRLEKQQIEAARLGQKIIAEIEDGNL